MKTTNERLDEIVKEIVNGQAQTRREMHAGFIGTQAYEKAQAEQTRREMHAGFTGTQAVIRSFFGRASIWLAVLMLIVFTVVSIGAFVLMRANSASWIPCWQAVNEYDLQSGMLIPGGVKFNFDPAGIPGTVIMAMLFGLVPSTIIALFWGLYGRGRG